MRNKIKSKVLLIIVGMLCLITIFVVQKKEVIFQEGNPIPMGVAITNLVLQDGEIAKVKGSEEVRGVYGYLVKRGEMEPYIKMMEKEGWRFVQRDEISNALEFEKGNTSKRVSYQYYTRWYTIIYS